ncbi:MAG TPA: T9SS type A sorting domain-containing protein [Chryseolinea sp.]
MRKIIVAALLWGWVSSYGQSPGGVSTNLRWWLKANAGAYTDNGTTLATNGQAVQFWRDQSTVVNHATQGTAGNRPTYQTNIINGNPALRFTQDHYLDGTAVSGIGGTDSFYMLMVFKQLTYQTNGGNDQNGTFVLDRPTATNNLTSFKVINTDKYFYQRRDDAGNNLGGPISTTPVNTSSFVIADFYRNYVSAASSSEGFYLNGRLEVSQTGPTTTMTGPIIRLGRHATVSNNGLDGYFAEIAMYNTNLSATQRQQIESYFAVKYGITLDQTTLTNYLRSDGTTIYPATTVGYTTYVSDIAGVGQDNAASGSGLLQTASQSQNTNAVVSIAISNAAGTLVNNEFMLWGSNNGSLTSPNSSDVDGTTIKRRLSRVWRVAETGGDVGNVNISFDLSTVPGSKTGSDLRLLVDADGAFNSGATATSGTLAGSVFTVNNINLADGNYFTVGSTNTSTTPLPVEVTDFTVSFENPVVVAEWRTASELNNDHFTVERAGLDLSFDEVARVPGAGTSNTPLTYSIADENPFAGRSYYRLKQTDLDGTVSYAGTRSVYIPSSDKSLSVYPNPTTDGRQWKLKWSDSAFQLDHLDIFDQQGKLLETFAPAEHHSKEFVIQTRQALLPGLYILNVHYNGRNEFMKLVVR